MKKKLIYYSLCVLIANLAIIGFISLRISSSTLRKSVSETNLSIVRQTMENIDFLLEVVERETINAFEGIDFNSFLDKAKDPDLRIQVENSKQVTRMIAQFISVVSDVESIYIVGENGVILSNASVDSVQFDVGKFRKQLGHSDGRLLWTYTSVESYTLVTKNVGLSKAIFDSEGAYSGFVVMLLKEKTLLNLYPEADIKKMMLADENDTIISSNEKKFVGTPIQSVFDLRTTSRARSGARVESPANEIKVLDNERYFITSIDSNYTQWRLFIATPYTDILRVLLTEEKRLAVWMLSGFLGFVALMVWLATDLMKPLRKLNRTLDAMNGLDDEFHKLEPPPDKRKMFRSFKKVNFKTRLALVLTISILVPVILLIALSYQFTQRIVEKKAVEAVALNSEQIKKRVESYVGNLEQTIYYFYTNNEFIEVMGQYAHSAYFPDGDAAATIRETAEYAMKQKKEVFYIDIYNAGFKQLYVSQTRDPKFSYPPLDAAALDSNRWMDTYKDYYNEHLFTFFKRIADFTDSNDQGYVLITAKEAFLEQNYSNSENGNDETYIINGQGVIMSSVNKNKIGRSLEEPYLKLIDSSKYESFEEGHHADQEFLLAHYVVGNTGWRLVHISSLQYVNDSMEQIFFYNLLVLLISALAIGLFILRYTARISKPVDRLTREVVSFANQLFEYEQERVKGNELEQLRINIYKLISKIDKLIKEVYEIGIKNNKAELNKKEAELAMLQAQINPHFLYNTLDIIRWKSIILADGENEVTDIVETLSDYFRLSLSKGKRMITIAEEIQHVRSYMKIMGFRYMDKANLEISVPEELQEFLIPKITLQPIVENALYHGIKHREGTGVIRISGSFGREALELEIFDDGVGIPPDQLEALKQNGFEAGGYGLKNVQQRIRMLFGEPYGIGMDSVFSEYTKVIIRIPYTKNDGDAIRGEL